MFTYPIDDEMQLVLLQPHHAAALFGVYERNREHFGRWQGDLAWATGPDAVAERIKRGLQQLADGRAIRCGIVYRGELVGRVALHQISSTHNRCEIGISLDADHQGGVIATRATRAMLDYGFGVWGLHRVEALCGTDNVRSRAIPEKLGFQQEAILRREVISNGQPIDSAVYGMLAHEWTITSGPHRFALRIDDDLELALLMPWDAEALYALAEANRERLQQWLGWVYRVTDVDGARAYIHTALTSLAEHGVMRCGIWYKGRFAGRIAYVHTAASTRMVEIGYWLGDEFTGKGIATRATHAMTAAAFETLAMNRVLIRAGVDNTASRAVAERLGFQFEGVSRASHAPGGKLLDIANYTLLASEWAQQRERQS